jgi:hypothetical protein
MHLLAKRPEDRPQTAKEVAEMLLAQDRVRKNRLSLPPPLPLPVATPDWIEATVAPQPIAGSKRTRKARSSPGRWVALAVGLCFLVALVPVVYLGFDGPFRAKAAAKTATSSSAAEQLDEVLAELSAMRRAIAAADKQDNKAALTEQLRALLRFHAKNARSTDPRLREAAALANELAGLLAKTNNIDNLVP